MKTIFAASYCFPDEKNEQLGRFVFDQLIELQGKGIKIVVLNVRRNKDINSTCIKKRIENGITIFETDIFPLALYKIPRITEYLYLKKYKKLYDAAVGEFGKPDKLYAHFTFPTGMALEILSRKQNIPLVVLEHQSLYFREKIKKYIVKRLSDTVYSSNAFMCVSSQLKESIVKKICCPEDKVIVALNTISPIYRYSEKEKRKDEFCLFSAGNLVKGKRFDLLIEAFAEIKNKGVKAELRIAGDGTEYTKLTEIIDQYHLNEDVKLLGRINKMEMLKEYQKCDIFVLPSLIETYGIVYREALMVGRPVISSDNGGIRQGWKDMYGTILGDTNVSTLSKEMHRMIETYDDYNLEEISRNAQESFSSANTIQSILTVL